jgi:uncharacterized protein with von Willebrand factor type A (vWA) domain
MKQIDIEYCTRCQFKKENGLLPEIVYNEDRYLHDLVKKAQQEPDSALYQEAVRQMDLRLKNDMEDEETDETSEGIFQSDNEQELGNTAGVPRQERDDINEEDIRKSLEEYEHDGYISIQKGKVIVTSKGVRKLAAGALERILKNLNRKSSGSYPIEKLDFGVDLSLHTRRYEVGDDYASVDLERTSLNALKRSGQLNFEPEDFEVYEEIHQSKLCAGIIIDESGSMRDTHKLEAAMETALALSRLIMKEPGNSLKVFVYSDKVKQIEPWAIVNEVISGGDTDIKAALAAFRRAVRHEYGDKQAYLITDTEPNNEDGRHLPFEKAATGLIEEASHYRQEKIGLNIIMLDEAPELKSLASNLARRNLGRVFFTSPSRLGEVLVEDYLKSRREGFPS